jgi:antitoxin component of MazEF toxin-antitoxin module
MARRTLKVARIGNSRGVRLPADSLRRYQIGDEVVMEERADGILLRAAGPAIAKLSWEETVREMARAHEDWSEWDATSRDGLEDVPWDPASKVADRAASRRPRPPRKPKRK